MEGPSEEEEEGSEIYGVTTFVGLTPKQVSITNYTGI